MIVNYNGGQLILDCVRSILRFTENCELVIVDNASSDGSVEKLAQLYTGIRVLRNPTNLGFAKANNIGIRESQGEYVVLMNSDIVVREHWLENLLQCVEHDPRIGVATPKLLRMNGRIDSTGHLFSFFEVEGKNRGEGEKDGGQYDSSTELLSCDFACPIIKRELTEHIGLLDERFFFYHEDIDFCLRARLAGWRVVFCPSSVVSHHRTASTPLARRRTLSIQRKRYLLRLCLKSYSLASLVRVLFHQHRRIISLTTAILAGLKNRDWDYVGLRSDELLALFSAFFWNSLHLPLRERHIVQQSRRIVDAELQRISELSMSAHGSGFQ